MKNFMKEIQERWNADTPSFWKNIRNWSIKIGGSAVALIGVDKLFDLQTYGVHPIIFTIAGYVIAACAAIGLSAQITKKDNNDSN